MTKHCEHSGVELEPSNKKEISYEELAKAWDRMLIPKSGQLMPAINSHAFNSLCRNLGLCPKKPKVVEFEAPVRAFSDASYGEIDCASQKLRQFIGKRVKVRVEEVI